jgi:hypothetical protein
VIAILLASAASLGGASQPPESVDPMPPERPASAAPAKAAAPRPAPPRIELDPSARMLEEDDASEHWTLYIELDGGHRIAQRFLITNAGPGEHNAVAQGHLVEPGREPYEYVNGRMRARWTLSKDRRSLDIAASHLDLHRPTGELRITKDDIEIRLSFDFGADALSARVPADRLPKGMEVDVLAVAAPTRGTIRAPWMSEPLEARGRTWLVHSAMKSEESSLLDRRIEIYGMDRETAFYGLQIHRGHSFDKAWALFGSHAASIVESTINIDALEATAPGAARAKTNDAYRVPGALRFSAGRYSGLISLGREWLRFDPLAVIPQPIQWFIRRSTNPQQVWAEARIGVSISATPETPSLPEPGEAESDSNSNRETESETAERSVAGVASITFLNPTKRR